MIRHISRLAPACWRWALPAFRPTRLSGQPARQGGRTGPNDPDYARAAVEYAVKPAGQVVYLGPHWWSKSPRKTSRCTDVEWPRRRQRQGNTNRLGGWWSYACPARPGGRLPGSVRNLPRLEQARKWVATCTLKAGPAATDRRRATRPTRWIGRRLSINRGRAPAS